MLSDGPGSNPTASSSFTPSHIPGSTTATTSSSQSATSHFDSSSSAAAAAANDESIQFGIGRPIDYYGNRETMNLSQLVYKNCCESHYTQKELSKVTDLWGVIQHIVKYVKHLEAWERGSENQSSSKFSGGVRGVARSGLISSTFCIMLKLNEFKITMGDLYELAKFKNNPYVQAIALIYARFVLTHDPELWKFFRHFVTIEDKTVNVSNTFNKSMTLGEISRRLLLDPKWCDQILPRVSNRLLDQFNDLIDKKLGKEEQKSMTMALGGGKFSNNANYDNKKQRNSRHSSNSGGGYRNNSKNFANKSKHRSY
ncbi:MAG: PRP38 pre-mRNA processing factor 38 domain-containing protein B [Marteilia pararefringens]